MNLIASRGSLRKKAVKQGGTVKKTFSPLIFCTSAVYQRKKGSFFIMYHLKIAKIHFYIGGIQR